MMRDQLLEELAFDGERPDEIERSAWQPAAIQVSRSE
jgi:hypothetical protein